MPAVFANLAASRSQHISSQKIAQLGLVTSHAISSTIIFCHKKQDSHGLGTDTYLPKACDAPSAAYNYHSNEIQYKW
jgi:hypothetical protein